MDMHPEQDHACGGVLRLSGRSGTSDHQGSLFPEETIQMKLTMRKESEYSKCLSLLPSNWTHAVLCGQQDARWLVYFVCLEIACCFWWWEQRWGSGTGTTVPQPAALHQIIKKMTLLKKNFCGTELCVCVFTQSLLCASSGCNAKMPFICCC